MKRLGGKTGAEREEKRGHPVGQGSHNRQDDPKTAHGTGANTRAREIL
ncbi:MAG: hypothetical protein H7308_14470 [Chthonomonadaceae bacterium]|nr:hypothetical protein [Chthonomonadaceae bacterium]